MEQLQDPRLRIISVYWQDATGQSGKHQLQLPAKATEGSASKPFNDTEPLLTQRDKDVCVVLLVDAHLGR